MPGGGSFARCAFRKFCFHCLMTRDRRCTLDVSGRHLLLAPSGSRRIVVATRSGWTSFGFPWSACVCFLLLRCSCWSLLRPWCRRRRRVAGVAVLRSSSRWFSFLCMIWPGYLRLPILEFLLLHYFYTIIKNFFHRSSIRHSGLKCTLSIWACIPAVLRVKSSKSFEFDTSKWQTLVMMYYVKKELWK